MERLDKHFEKLTQASFARYGFAYAELLSRWPDIVGQNLSRYCVPERIKWPRGSGGTAQKLGGTLIIRVSAGRGLDLQHQTHHIIERINQFYGYGAVTSVKIVHSHEPIHKPLKTNANSLDDKAQQRLAGELQSISDEKLRQALQKLGTGALARSPGSPQAK